jgi:LacI family transcriptional regulator
VELAKLAGVSQSTVSRCLNDSPLVSDETKARVKKIAEEYSFQFNTNARGLKTNRTGVVGYIFSQDFTGFANHYIQSDLYYRIRMQLLPYGMDVVPVFDDQGLNGENSIAKSISNRRYDALIFNRQSVSEHVASLLKETNIPHIFIYDTNECVDAPFMIAPRHTKIGYLAGEAFCKAGYRNFVEVTGPSKRIDVMNKHAGFLKALQEHGMALPDSHILCADYRLERAEEITHAEINLFRPGTAVFAQNDMIALGVLEALKQTGLRVPDDIALIGVDNIAMGHWFHPQLTTVAIDYDQIISLTVKWVLNVTEKKMPKEYRHFLDGQLIIRDTFSPDKK